jgi:hypothetical protein
VGHRTAVGHRARDMTRSRTHAARLASRARSTRPASVTLLWLGALCLTRPAQALVSRFSNAVIDSNGIETGSAELQRFYFLTGGTFELTVTGLSSSSPTPSLWLVLCQYSEISFPLNFAGAEGACVLALDSYNGTNSCFLSSLSEGSEVRIQVLTKNQYSAGVVLCDEGERITMSGVAQSLNPNGEHLGSNHVPIPRVYLGFIILWIALAVTYALYLWKMRSIATWIHFFLVVAMLTRIAWLVAARQFWVHASSTSAGIPLQRLLFDSPSGDETETWMYLTFLALNQAVFFCFFAVISQGWLITRRFTERSEFFVDLGFFVGLVAVNVLCRRVDSSAILIALYLLYPGTFGLALANCSRNLKTLRLQSMMIMQRQQDGSRVIAAKEKIFRSLQGVVFWYISLKIVASLASLFLEGLEWCKYLIDELIDLFASLLFGSILKPNTVVNPFNTHFVSDWEAMFEGTINSIADRIAALGLSVSEIPQPEFYVAHVGARTDGQEARVDVSDDEENEGVGCFHLILVEHPSERASILANLAIAVPDQTIEEDD